jgi:hypothetical protein
LNIIETRIAEKFEALIGLRLRLCRILSFLAIAILEGMSRVHLTIFDAYFWKLSVAASNFADFLKDLFLGEVTVLFVAVFLFVPKVSSILLATSSAWMTNFAGPMLKRVGTCLSDETSKNMSPGDLAMLVRHKSEGVRFSHAIGDVFEMAVMLFLWMLWPRSLMGFSASEMKIFAFFVAALWLLGGYAINYLIVTKVLPADVLAKCE